MPTTQYLVVRTKPRNPTVNDNYDIYMANTDSRVPLGTDKEQYTLHGLGYVKFGNVCREIARHIQNQEITSVVTNLHSETEPFTEKQKKRLDELVNLALKGEFQW